MPSGNELTSLQSDDFPPAPNRTKFEISDNQRSQYEADLKKWESHPDFAMVKSRYHIETNGEKYRVMRRYWWGWKQVKSSVLFEWYRNEGSGAFPPAVDENDAYCAMVENIIAELKKSNIHDWKPIET